MKKRYKNSRGRGIFYIQYKEGRPSDGSHLAQELPSKTRDFMKDRGKN
jgi:hypothetical protein